MSAEAVGITCAQGTMEEPIEVMPLEMSSGVVDSNGKEVPIISVVLLNWSQKPATVHLRIGPSWSAEPVIFNPRGAFGSAAVLRDDLSHYDANGSLHVTIDNLQSVAVFVRNIF